MIGQSDAPIRQLMGELHDAAPPPHDWAHVATWDRPGDSRVGRRALAVAAALVLLVGGLAATAAVLRRDGTNTAPIEPPPAGPRVELAPGFDVAVVGGPVSTEGITVYRGALGPEVSDELIASLGGATEVALAPVAAGDYPISDAVIHLGIDTIVTVGRYGDTVVAVHGRADEDSGNVLRCVSTALIDQIDEWTSACSPFGPIGSRGPAESWLAWPGLPPGTALVAVLSLDGEVEEYQRPIADSVAFPRPFINVELVAFDRSGAELERWPFRSSG